MPDGIVASLREYRFGLLLAALLGMLIYQPLADLIAPDWAPLTNPLILAAVFAWLMVSAVFASSRRKRTPCVSLFLGLTLLIVQVIDLSLDSEAAFLAWHVIAILFLGHIVLILLGYIFHQSRVTTDTIFTALCVYLMIGILWAFVYSLVAWGQEGAFRYVNADAVHMEFDSDATSLPLYFSFVTMTTLGYGDITPTTAAARSLVMLQAVLGQFYLTVLVAWLVGLHIAHSRSQKSGE